MNRWVDRIKTNTHGEQSREPIMMDVDFLAETNTDAASEFVFTLCPEGVVMKAETKTLQEWADIDGLIIYDPDGFDRSDPEIMSRKFTRQEYDAGIMLCSIVGRPVDCKQAEKDNNALEISDDDIKILKDIAITHKHYTHTNYRLECASPNEINEIIEALAEAIENYLGGGDK